MQKSRMPWHLVLVLPLVGLGLTGCAANGTVGDPVKGIAASIVAARSFDQAIGALNRDDNNALEKAGSGLRRASKAMNDERLTSAFVAGMALEASQTLTLAQSSQGNNRTELKQEAEKKYRAALAFLPEEKPEDSLDANTLNTLGYFLADMGRSRADFEQAAQLTLAAYKKWPMPSGILGYDPRLSRAVLAQDSYAWALFKLGKYEEARKQQEEVMKILEGAPAGYMTSEIPFHMAEIYNAEGQLEKAREAYETAIQLQPEGELKVKIELGLKSLDAKRV